MEIPLGVVGEILEGAEVGRFLEVLRSPGGGYLVLTYGAADRSGETFDIWLESMDEVEASFGQGEWIVRWIRTSST